ncbi:MAG: hypothetical protein J4F39_02505 [Candidatus Latescibacteria bacterium]|nr:hypothetical protein [Candidatus Latescibacterota bacterium]
MKDLTQLQPAHTFLTCGQLPGRETNIVRREMANASGGIGLPPIGPIVIARLVAEAIFDYFGVGD